MFACLGCGRLAGRTWRARAGTIRAIRPGRAPRGRAWNGCMGGIRLFLALAVLMEHFGQQVLAPNGMDFDPAWMLNVNGARAVLLFYVISGFLISYVLHEKYRNDRNGTLAFYRSRFMRIYPLWWTVLAFTVLLDLWRGASNLIPPNPIPAVALLGLDWIVPLWSFPDLDWSVLLPGTEVAWTLGAEVTFYLMAPLILRSNRAALMLLLGSAAVRAGILATVARGDPGFANLTFFFFPATFMFFLLGHFGAVLCRYRSISLVGSLGFLCVAIALCYGAGNQITFDGWVSHLLPVCFALALPGIFAATKDSRLFNFLGDLTYPLYLTDNLAIALLFAPRRLDTWFLLPLQSKSAALLLSIGVTVGVAVAVATHYLIEPRARALLERLSIGSDRRISSGKNPVA
jgi:peptidoglycan/LPS O-acetylase OafA/YrhL